ncbi:hypothetical protein HDU96_003036 [Phlyctochytrium bullatum]|nr:hypothetical protein HDU96_003036 [Phlyctochytrium bullatum]
MPRGDARPRPRRAAAAPWVLFAAVLAFLARCTTSQPMMLETSNDTTRATLLIPMPLAAEAASVRLRTMGFTTITLMAAQDIQRLFNISVRFLIFNNWTPTYNRVMPVSATTSGGFSAASVYDRITQESNVLGVVGDYYSTTTLFTAGLVSQLQKPFCGATQGTVGLSNKKKYPYFFRIISAKGMGIHYITILRSFGMRRLCIIEGAGSLSVTMSNEIRDEAVKAGLKVSQISVADPKSYAAQFDRARRQKCRYFFISAASTDAAEIFKNAAAVDPPITGPDFLWMSYNKLVETGTEPYSDSIYGTMVVEGKDTANKTAQDAFTKRFWEFAETSPERAAMFPDVNVTQARIKQSGSTTPNAQVFYDCIMLMLSGYRLALGDERFRSVEQFAARSAELNVAAFLKTGYVNNVGQKREINEWGDLKEPQVVSSPNKTNLKEFFSDSAAVAFGGTSLDGTTFTQYFPTTFAGGAGSPPVDVDEGGPTSIQEWSYLAIALRVIQSISLFSSLISLFLLVYFHRKLGYGAPAVSFGTISHILASASTVLSVGVYRHTVCFAQSLVFLAGLSSMVGPSFYSVMIRVWYFGNPRRMKMAVRLGKTVLSACLLVVLNCVAITLAFWRDPADPNGLEGTIKLQVRGSLGWSPEITCIAFISERGFTPRITFLEVKHSKLLDVSLKGVKPSHVIMGGSIDFKEEVGNIPGRLDQMLVVVIPQRHTLLFRFLSELKRDEIAETLKGLATRHELRGQYVTENRLQIPTTF